MARERDEAAEGASGCHRPRVDCRLPDFQDGAALLERDARWRSSARHAVTSGSGHPDAVRNDFRAQVMAHKKMRQVRLGPNATLYFEDRTTIQYQVQEMLRAERIFEAEGIEDELRAYNPLIPDGTNWKTTFMLEYPDIDERQQALARLIGIEDRVGAGRRPRPRVRDCRRGSGARNRHQDFFGPLPAFRALASDDSRSEAGRGDRRRRGSLRLRPRRDDSLASDLT